VGLEVQAGNFILLIKRDLEIEFAAVELGGVKHGHGEFCGRAEFFDLAELVGEAFEEGAGFVQREGLAHFFSEGRLNGRVIRGIYLLHQAIGGFEVTIRVLCVERKWERRD